MTSSIPQFAQTTVFKNPKWEHAIQTFLDCRAREDEPLSSTQIKMLETIGAPSKATLRPESAAVTRPSAARTSRPLSAAVPTPKTPRAVHFTTQGAPSSPGPGVKELEYPSQANEKTLIAAPEESTHVAKGPESSPAPSSPTRSPTKTSLSKKALASLDLYLTTYQLSMGLRELRGAGELFQDVLQATKPVRTGEDPFRSAYAESLKSGDLTAWKQQCLKTNYALDNERAEQTIQDSTLQKTGRERFFEYVHAAKLYYGDLFDDATVAKVDAWLKTASTEEKEHFLTFMREVHSSIEPTGGRNVSHSTAMHNRQPRFGDESINALVAKLSQIQTYGYPKEVTLRPISAPQKRASSSTGAPRASGGGGVAVDATAAANHASSTTSATHKRPPAPKPVYKPETLSSNFSLSQPEAAADQPNSSYKVTYSRPIRQPRTQSAKDAKSSSAVHWPTMAFGANNPHLVPQRIDTLLVPKYYIQSSTMTFKQESQPNARSTYMASYTKANGALGKDSGPSGGKVLTDARMSTIPIGKYGIQLLPTKESVYGADFIKHPIVLDKATAEGHRDRSAAPSISVGTVAPHVTEEYWAVRNELKATGRI